MNKRFLAAGFAYGEDEAEDIQTLLDDGADVNSTNSQGKTAFLSVFHRSIGLCGLNVQNLDYPRETKIWNALVDETLGAPEKVMNGAQPREFSLPWQYVTVELVPPSGAVTGTGKAAAPPPASNWSRVDVED